MHPDIASLPEATDMALIALAAKMSVEAVEECGKKDIKAVTITSSGFPRWERRAKSWKSSFVSRPSAME